MRLGKIKCAAKVGRLMGGFAALFILRRDSQTALPKIALSVGFCLAVRVALSDRVADNIKYPKHLESKLSDIQANVKIFHNCLKI